MVQVIQGSARTIAAICRGTRLRPESMSDAARRCGVSLGILRLCRRPNFSLPGRVSPRACSTASTACLSQEEPVARRLDEAVRSSPSRIAWRLFAVNSQGIVKAASMA